jgi:hypothetical protein
MEDKPGNKVGGDRNAAAGDSSKGHMIPVWFFIGLTLLTYGIMILVTGIQELSHPPATVLAELHAPIWWGAIMAVIGAIYVSIFRPRS